ncbi:MAG: hypothetical protein ACLRRT_10940 [Ruthenibacterium lactatiformans]
MCLLPLHPHPAQPHLHPSGHGGHASGAVLLLTTVGSLLWNILLVYLGALAGQSWPAVTAALEQASGWVKAVLVVACAAGVSALFYGRRKNGRRRGNALCRSGKKRRKKNKQGRPSRKAAPLLRQYRTIHG